MSDLSMWFGTRGYMQWVPCPLVDSDMSKVGWNSQAQYLNGGTRIRSSVAAHKEYNLAWGLQERDNIRTITDYADGVYGDDLIYFVDPFAADKNVLPQYWATPALAAEDAPILTGTAKPSLVETDSNTNGYPRYSAVYYVLPSDPKKNIYVPIPPGYTAWVGFHGQKPDDSTAYVRVRQAIGATGYGTSTALTPLSNDTTVQVNANFNSSTTVHGIVLDLQGTGTLIMTSLIVQLRKTSSEYGTTRTNLVTNPSMESVTSGAVVMRRNLVTNPSFETNTTGWGGSATLSRVTSEYFVGSASLQVVTTAVSQRVEQTPIVPVSAGGAYTASAYVKAEVGKSFTVELRELGADGTTIIGTTTSATMTGIGAWQRVSVSRTFGATGVNGQIILRNQTAGAHTFYVDAVMLEASSVMGDYFDGSTTDALGWDYAWSGTANASISTAACAATTVRTNLSVNPSVETNSNSWGTYHGAGGAGTSARITTDAAFGTSCFQMTWTTASTTVSGGFYSTNIAVTAGTTYTGSGYVKSSKAQTLRVIIEWKDAGGTTLSTTPGTNVLVAANTWTRLSVSGIAPANAAIVTLTFYSNTGGSVWNIGDTLQGDAILFEASSTLGDYFDGSVVSADADLTNSWSGTAHASTSLMRGVGVAGVTQGFGAASIQSTGWSSTGTKSIRIIPTTTANNSWVRFDIPTTVGATYTVMGKLRQTQALAGSQWPNGRRINAYNSAITTVVGQSAQSTNAAGIYSHSVTFVAASTTTPILLGNGASAGNGDVWWDDLLVVQGSYTGDYFDGSTAGYGNVTYGWTNSALPNASTSYQYVTPTTGGYISGQGHSGCKFAEQPKLQNYSSAMDKSALTAKLVEVGAWA